MEPEFHGSQLDHLRRVTTEQTAEISRLRHELALERFRRLTLEIERAIERDDRDGWAKACTERLRLGVTFEEVDAQTQPVPRESLAECARFWRDQLGQQGLVKP